MLEPRRIAAAVGLIAVVALTVLPAVMTSEISGGAVEKDGRYYNNVHGRLFVITRDQWLDARRVELRGSAGMVVLFGGLAALYLTQPARAPRVAVSANTTAEGVPG